MIIGGTNEQAVVGFITTRFRELKDARSEKEDIWMDCVRAYLSEFSAVWDERRNQEGRSTRFMPLSFDAVETLTANISSITTPDDRWIHPEPAISGALKYDDESSEEIRALLLQQLGKMGFRRQYLQLLKQCAITGSCPYLVGWRKDMAVDYPAYQQGMAEWQIDNQVAWARYQDAMQQWQQAAKIAQVSNQQPPPRPSLVAPEPPPVSRNGVIYSGPTFEVGDIFNFVVDPFSTDTKHQLKFQRSWASKAVLQSMSQKNQFGYSVYDNTANIVEAERRTGVDSGPMIESYSAFGLQVPDSSDVELITGWGTMEIPNGNRDGRSMFVSFNGTVANEVTLLRWEPTFLWSGDSSAQLATYRDVPGQVYGMGAIEPALGVQDLANVRTNQNIDIVNYIMNPEYKAVDDGFVRDTLVSAPSKIHWVGDIGNLVPMEKNIQGLQMSMQDLVLLKNEFKMITKSGAPLAGDSAESATKTRLDARMIGGDVGMVAEHIEDTFLSKVLGLFIELDAQYITEPEMVKSIQKGVSSFTHLSPEVIKRGWAIEVRGTKFSADRQERLQNLMMFYQLVLGNPMMVASVDTLMLGKKVYSELGFSDGDEIFNDAVKADQILGEMITYGLVGSPAAMQAQQAASGPGGSESASSVQ